MPLEKRHHPSKSNMVVLDLLNVIKGNQFLGIFNTFKVVSLIKNA